MTTPLHPVVAEVTARIVERSAPGRTAYLDRIRAAGDRGPARGRLACANLAHGFAASDAPAKQALRGRTKPNVAIVSAYNDMLSAHQPFETYPRALKQAVMRAGGIAQFAGGVPAMCDGITQGRDGMQLSLYSRDVIAMSTAIALSHDMFDGALMLGVCDKIVPGLLIGALSFGHLPTVFVPAGPMESGLPNGEKAEVRQLYAEGKVGRDELLEAEAASYHSAGTCTFYGTANSNQLLMEVLGLHLPGSSFVNPGTPLREALTRAAGARVTELTRQGGENTPIGEIVDELAIVNACVALLASGGSTNHTLHLVAIARAAGITLTWDDLSDLSAVVPSLAKIYPNGEADVNHFHAAGGIAFLVHTLLRSGLLHERRPHDRRPRAVALHDRAEAARRGADLGGGPEGTPSTPTVLRPADDPFAPDGGLKLLAGQPGPRRHQDLRGEARAPGRHRPGPGLRPPGRVPPGLRRRRARRSRPRRRDPLPGARRERDARAAQAHPRPRRAAGPRPEGRDRDRRPDVRRLGQGARGHPRHPGGRARRPARPGARRGPDHRRRVRRAPRPARRPGRARATARPPDAPRRDRSGPAPAASCSPPSGPPSARPTPAPACSPASRSRRRRSPLSPSERSLLDRVPVVPVVVVEDARPGRARRPGPGGRRAAGHRADPADPGRARRDPGDRRRGARDPRRRGHRPRHRVRPRRRRTPARSSSSPRARPRRCWRA